MRDLRLKVFSTSQELKKGLLDKDKISMSDLYLFPGVDTITTKGMKFPIKVIFINSRAEIVSIVLMTPGKQHKEKGAAAAIECHPFFNSANLNELKDKIIKAL